MTIRLLPLAAVACLSSLLVLLSPGCSSQSGPQSTRFDDAFWRQWGDGKAELSLYSLETMRYGQLRRGTAVSIFVTEPFSKSAKIKADPGKHAQDDLVQVLKLNLIMDFPTGIYDYNLMTSSFAALSATPKRPAGSPLKVSFGAQEWCGHTYHQLRFDPQKIREEIHSYFDSEGDQENTLSYPEGAVSEDLLLHWARGFAPPFLKPGESAEVQILTSLAEARLLHKPLAWRRGELRRSAATEQIRVGAGLYTAERWEARAAGGTHWTFFVEAAPSKKILSWETSAGQKAELLGSVRLPYWELNTNDVPSLLRQLGRSADQSGSAGN